MSNQMTDEQKLKAGRGEFNYKGNLCRQIIGGWVIQNTVCTTFEEVEDVLMNLSSILSESIDRGGVTIKNGFSVTNTVDKK